MLATSTAILGLRELIKAILPGTHYETEVWVKDELVLTLNSVASQLEGLHADVSSKQTGDHATIPYKGHPKRPGGCLDHSYNCSGILNL